MPSWEGWITPDSWLVLAMYLKLKMSGPHGPITVEGIQSWVTKCEEKHVKYAESACAKEDLMAYKEKVDPADPSIIKKADSGYQLEVQPAQDTKKVDFVP